MDSIVPEAGAGDVLSTLTPFLDSSAVLQNEQKCGKTDTKRDLFLFVSKIVPLCALPGDPVKI